MRREAIIAAVERIQTDLVESGLGQMINNAVDIIHNRSDSKTGLDFISFTIVQNYLVRRNSRPAEERLIEDIIEVDRFSDASFWEKFAKEPDPSTIYTARNDLRFALKSLPRFVELLEQSHLKDIKSGSEKIPSALQGKELVTLILSEDETQFSSPLRAIAALDGLTKIYEAISRIYGVDGSDLILLACDSGSPKSFDILGAAKTISGVKEIILGIWDRKVYHRHNQLSASLDILDKSLPIISRLNDMSDNSEIDPAEAEQIRRGILEGAGKLLGAGVTTPEMYQNARMSPELIMRPEPKLLAAPSGISEDENEELEQDMSDGSDATTTAEDIETMRRLAKAMGLSTKLPAKPRTTRKRNPRTPAKKRE